MRRYSTPQSAEDGEVSQLAIVETVLASLVSIYVAFRWNIVEHVAIGAVVAPKFVSMGGTFDVLDAEVRIARGLPKVGTAGGEIRPHASARTGLARHVMGTVLAIQDVRASTALQRVVAETAL